MKLDIETRQDNLPQQQEMQSMAAVLVIGLLLFVQGMIHTLLHTRLFNRRPTFSDTYAVAEILFFTGSSANTISRPARDTDVVNPNDVSTESCDPLRGREGRDGLPGLPGRDGRDGEKGDVGLPGRFGRLGLTGVSGPRGTPGAGSVVYTRWGRTSCPPTASLVYSGRTAGSWYGNTGGGANYLCMPNDPDYSTYCPGVQNRSPIYGTEYQIQGGCAIPGAHDHNVPCAVCHTQQESVIMIPAKTQCPDSWRVEYTGYLMSTHINSAHHRTMYECVDRSPETIPGSAANTNGAVFYHVEANCNGLPCGPYDPEKELTCVVCTI